MAYSINSTKYAMYLFLTGILQYFTYRPPGAATTDRQRFLLFFRPAVKHLSTEFSLDYNLNYE